MIALRERLGNEVTKPFSFCSQNTEISFSGVHKIWKYLKNIKISQCIIEKNISKAMDIFVKGGDEGDVGKTIGAKS